MRAMKLTHAFFLHEVHPRHVVPGARRPAADRGPHGQCRRRRARALRLDALDLHAPARARGLDHRQRDLHDAQPVQAGRRRAVRAAPAGWSCSPPSTTPPSFTGSSGTSGCREHATAQSPRPLCLPRETTSPRSPAHSRSNVTGPPARVLVCPDSAARHGVRRHRHPAASVCPRPRTLAGSTHYRRGVIRAVPRLDRPETRPVGTENGRYVTYDPTRRRPHPLRLPRRGAGGHEGAVASRTPWP